jgi:hypothetical protein
LILRGFGISFGKKPVVAPRLRRLALRTGSLRKKTGFAPLATAELPLLEDLELWFGDSYYSADVKAKDLAWLLAGERFPKLTSLGLMNAEFADELPALLASSALLPRLRRLDLSMGTMGETGARALLAHRDAFAHLESLSVQDNLIPKAEAKALKKAFGDQIGRATAQRFLDGDGDEDRFVAVGE